jgi:hypothetical protein
MTANNLTTRSYGELTNREERPSMYCPLLCMVLALPPNFERICHNMQCNAKKFGYVPDQRYAQAKMFERLISVFHYFCVLLSSAGERKVALLLFDAAVWKEGGKKRGRRSAHDPFDINARATNALGPVEGAPSAQEAHPCAGAAAIRFL